MVNAILINFALEQSVLYTKALNDYTISRILLYRLYYFEYRSSNLKKKFEEEVKEKV